MSYLREDPETRQKPVLPQAVRQRCCFNRKIRLCANGLGPIVMQKILTRYAAGQDWP